MSGPFHVEGSYLQPKTVFSQLKNKTSRYNCYQSGVTVGIEVYESNHKILKWQVRFIVYSV